MRKTFSFITLFLVLCLSLYASIDEQEARDIAFKDAGVSESDIERISIKRDRDDSTLFYDIEFYTTMGHYYDYEISSNDGMIWSSEHEYNSKAREDRVTIDEDMAISLALGESGLNRSDVSNLKVKRDKDDGQVAYEIDFRTSDYKYEVEILENGTLTLLEYEKRGGIPSNRNKDLKSLDEALETSISYIPVSDISSLRGREDYDDGSYIYEIYGFVDGYEYDLELNAEDLSIISFSKELF